MNSCTTPIYGADHLPLFFYLYETYLIEKNEKSLFWLQMGAKDFRHLKFFRADDQALSMYNVR